MPIETLRQRLPEIGRIRLGERRQSKRSQKTYPVALERFRVTSQHEQVIQAVAERYGGEVSPWTDEGRHEWQVTVESPTLEVVLPPPHLQPMSQWFERWARTRSGMALCTHRCDGRTCTLQDVQKVGDDLEIVQTQVDCECDPEKPTCKPTTRLSLLLLGVEQVGCFRAETGSIVAAGELASMVHVAWAFAASGQYVPCSLSIEKRTFGLRTAPVIQLRVAKSLEALAALPPVPGLALPGPGEEELEGPPPGEVLKAFQAEVQAERAEAAEKAQAAAAERVAEAQAEEAAAAGGKPEPRVVTGSAYADARPRGAAQAKPDEPPEPEEPKEPEPQDDEDMPETTTKFLARVRAAIMKATSPTTLDRIEVDEVGVAKEAGVITKADYQQLRTEIGARRRQIGRRSR